MAAKKAAITAEDKSSAPRARLHKLTIKNFRAIGKHPVEIELDDIVVLVGANNTGKSSILRAYQVVMEAGKKGELALDDFPEAKLISLPEDYPTIELETVLFEDSKPPATKWIAKKENGDRHVRERWTWPQAGTPIKRGFNVEKNDWDENHGPWGAAGVAQENRPAPHRIEAFDNPKDQADAIISLLKKALNDRVKKLSEEGSSEGEISEYGALLETVKKLQNSVAKDAIEAIEKIREELSKSISSVFPGFTITLDARAENDIEKSISFFQAQPLLKMGPAGGHQSDLERQGSGARRTLLWNALKILADHKLPEKDGNKIQRPQVLLLDEPELCLHPAAIRDACNVLYSLPEGGNWQVMVTTHSPAFIDLSRNNTSIIRVERSNSGVVSGTTIFRPKNANLGEADKERLKLLNMYDPYVAEFFFGGKTVLVEGDTEFTVFREAVVDFPERFKGVHIVRARGKYTIISLCKILNKFGCPYAVLHDADTQKIRGKDGATKKNSAWAANAQILQEVLKAPPNTVRLAASLKNFETAMFGDNFPGEKPYNAWLEIRKDPVAKERVVGLLDYLVGNTALCPSGVLAWETETELAAAVLVYEPDELST